MLTSLVPDDKAPESILSLHESSGDQTLVTGFGERHHYLLRHFFGPFKILFFFLSERIFGPLSNPILGNHLQALAGWMTALLFE